MRLTTIAVTLLALAGCHKSEPNQTPETTGLTPAETQGAENSAGSFPSGPGAVPGSSGVGATGVEEPIDQPPAPDTPTR
jgi:hypothetical protein